MAGVELALTIVPFVLRILDSGRGRAVGAHRMCLVEAAEVQHRMLELQLRLAVGEFDDATTARVQEALVGDRVMENLEYDLNRLQRYTRNPGLKNFTIKHWANGALGQGEIVAIWMRMRRLRIYLSRLLERIAQDEQEQAYPSPLQHGADD
jgi:hypothetical protein